MKIRSRAESADQGTAQELLGIMFRGLLCAQSFLQQSGGWANRKLEFKEMVQAFHKAGIEVILDVVFNHTAGGK